MCPTHEVVGQGLQVHLLLRSVGGTIASRTDSSLPHNRRSVVQSMQLDEALAPAQRQDSQRPETSR